MSESGPYGSSFNEASVRIHEKAGQIKAKRISPERRLSKLELAEGTYKNTNIPSSPSWVDKSIGLDVDTQSVSSPPKAPHEETLSSYPLPRQTSSELLLIRLLQQRIAKLQEEKGIRRNMRTEEEEASRVQVVYEVHCQKHNSQTQFLDKPLAFGDSSDQDFHLRGQKLFPSNTDLFIERQRGALSFMVYKTLECCKSAQVPSEKLDNVAEELQHPRIKESIYITSRNLQDAFGFLAEVFADEVKYFPPFKVGSTITSPYLFYYNKRSFMMGLESLPEKHLSQIRLFREYVERSFGDEFSRVDNLTMNGKITAQYLPYIFQPGTVVISQKGREFLGFEQKDWPTPKDLKEDRILIYDSDDKELRNDPRALNQRYAIRCKNWDFGGSFLMNWTTILIDFGETESYTKNIKDLRVIPLRFAEPNVEENLRQRGSIFWNCRVRKFVSYNDGLNKFTRLKVRN